MDIKSYIESGILEQYLLGMTSQEESLEVQKYAMQYPEIQQELDNIEAALLKYADSYSTPPPAGLKQKILDQLDGDSNTIENKESNNNTTPSKNASNGWKILTILSAIILSALAAYHTSKTQALVKQTENLQLQYDTLKEDCDKKQIAQENINKQIAFLKDTNTQTVRMKGTPLSPISEGVVFWNKNEQVAYLDIASLPKPAPNKQYQLWAIVDGKPVDMGVFDLPASHGDLQAVPFIEKPQAFAVTLEPIGGVASPTMDQMYILGEV